MPLARLDNFLKNLNGNTLYVDPNELDSSDSIDNRGNSRIRPFKTIQRALLEAARFSYVPGSNNDLFDQTTIIIAPGTHFIDNRPGFYLDQNNVLRDVNGSTRTISELNISSNFDINDPSNQLYIFNSIDGGVIVPRGTSIVSTDLRKTKIKPKFVPNPVNDLIGSSAIFRLTGACYIFGFTIFDGDPVGKVYTDYTTNTTVPNFSHHKLTAFEYADDTNNIVKNNIDTGRTDLENYYYKVSLAYGPQSGRSIIDGFENFQPSVDENRIVGELGIGQISIVDATSGDGTNGTNVITVVTQVPHGLSPLTPIIITGLGQDEGPTSELEYNGNFVVAQVVNETTFTYILTNVPTQTLNPSTAGAALKVISDTVSSSSPYVFNCSLKSVYGMNGLHADGSKARGFKSMVTAQFTGISLQKDDRAFVEYDETAGGYNYQDNYGVDKFLHQSSRAKYRPNWETFHIKASNDAFIQCVSIFAIGYAKQFVAETGGDQSITNSNSNFGAIALYSSGFKDDGLPKDNHAFITHIIPPKDISSIESDVRFLKLDAVLTLNQAPANQYTRVYLKDYIDLLDPPPSTYRGFVLGGKENDLLYFTRANEDYPIFVSPSFKVEYEVTNIDSDSNIVTLSGIAGIATGQSGKIVSKNGDYPDGIVPDKLYNVRLTGGNGLRLYDNQLNSEINFSPVDIKNSVGLTTANLFFVSRVNEKSSGDVGSPIQWDPVLQNWYVGVSSVGAGSTDFFVNLSGVTEPTSFFRRKVDSRFNKDKAYRVRVVIPKESENASAPTSGFIIQKASNVLDSTLFQSDSQQLSATNPLTQVRNDGAIIDAWYNSGTVTVITSKAHNLSVGDEIEIYNLKSSNEPNPVGLGTGKGYNGRFVVQSIVNDTRFTYSLTRNPGSILSGISTSTTWLTERNCNQTSNYRVPPYTIYDSARNSLPYFINKKIKNDYQFYDIETIQEYSQNTTDGIYHVTLNAFKNIPTISPFDTEDYKLTQSIEKLYPQQDLDNPIADPQAAITKVSRKEIGLVVPNDVRKSTTKETVGSYIKDFSLGTKISGITTYFDTSLSAGIATATTSIPHGLGGIRRLTVITAGSGFENGIFHDIPLCDGSGVNATAIVRVESGVVVEATVQNPGSGYIAGDLLRVRGIPGSTNNCFVSVESVNYTPSSTDVIQIIGCATDENNGVFVIKSVTSNTITFYNNNAAPEVPENGVIFLSGFGYQVETVPDGSVYNSLTDTTAITLQEPHQFAVGSKVIFDDAIGNPSIKIGISTVSNVVDNKTFNVRGDASSAIRVFEAGLLSNPKDTNVQNENLQSRHYTICGKYKGRTSQQISSSATSFIVNDLFGLDKGDFIQINSEIMLVTRISGGEINVRRGLFGTRAVPHVNDSRIRKILIVPIELRRNSILRASGHTFEYVGFGPGNYSTGMPTNQDRILSPTETLTSQALNTNGGLVVYTGMNSNGEFFIGKTKFDAVTGKQIEVGIPEAESGNAATIDVVISNKVIINDELDATTARVDLNNINVLTDAFITGVTTVASVVNSTSPRNGALVVGGGIGADLDVNVGGKLSIAGSAGISSIRIGVTSVSTIDTFPGPLSYNLYLDSTGGTVVVNDNLHVSGNVNIAGVSTFLNQTRFVGIATFNSNVQINNNAAITGVTTFSNSIRVTGISTFASNLTVSGTSTLTGNVSAGASITSVGDIVAGPSAKLKGFGTIPIGGIIMWSGSIASIPTGWALCDGTSGTPDLRERFIVGAGGDNSTVVGAGYSVGATGGFNFVSLSTSEIPGHTHPITITGASVSISPTSVTTAVSPTTQTRTVGSFGSPSSITYVDTVPFTNNSVSASFTYSGNTGSNNTSTVSAHENRPPYYALAFIMRTV